MKSTNTDPPAVITDCYILNLYIQHCIMTLIHNITEHEIRIEKVFRHVSAQDIIICFNINILYVGLNEHLSDQTGLDFTGQLQYLTVISCSDIMTLYNSSMLWYN